MGKNLSNKYGQKLFDSAKKSTTDAIKTALKRAIQKTTEATGDLIRNRIADKITSVSKKKANNDNNNNNNNNTISSVNKNQIYSTYPIFIYVQLAFGGHCLHFQVYTINSVI